MLGAPLEKTLIFTLTMVPPEDMGRLHATVRATEKTRYLLRRPRGPRTDASLIYIAHFFVAHRVSLPSETLLSSLQWP